MFISAGITDESIQSLCALPEHFIISFPFKSLIPIHFCKKNKKSCNFCVTATSDAWLVYFTQRSQMFGCLLRCPAHLIGPILSLTVAPLLLEAITSFATASNRMKRCSDTLVHTYSSSNYYTSTLPAGSPLRCLLLSRQILHVYD